MNNLISGLGESKITLLSSAFTFVTGITLVLILVPRYLMIGLLATIVVAPMGGWVFQTYWARKELGITVNWRTSARIYITGFAAFAATYLVVTVLNLGGLTELVFGGFTFFVVYIVSLPLSGALRREDLTQLETMVDVLGPLRGVIRLVFSILGRMIRD